MLRLGGDNWLGQGAKRHLPWLLALALLGLIRSTISLGDLWLGTGLAMQALIVGGLMVRPRLPGATMIQIGTAANLVVMLANGASMPVSTRAAELAGAPSVAGVRHGFADSSSHLTWLGDVIPIEPLHIVVSVGDVALLVGILWFVAAVFRRLARMPSSSTNSEHSLPATTAS